MYSVKYNRLHRKLIASAHLAFSREGFVASYNSSQIVLLKIKQLIRKAHKKDGYRNEETINNGSQSIKSFILFRLHGCMLTIVRKIIL